MDFSIKIRGAVSLRLPQVKVASQVKSLIAGILENLMVTNIHLLSLLGRESTLSPTLERAVVKP